MPPTVSPTFARSLYAGLGALLFIEFAVRALSGSAILWIPAVVFAGQLIRAPYLDFRIEGDDVVVANLFSTRRIPLSTVASFSIRRRTLSVDVSGGERRRVEAYPLTWLPERAERRTEVVEKLNTWLQGRASDGTPMEVSAATVRAPSHVVDRRNYEAKALEIKPWVFSGTALLASAVAIVFLHAVSG